jgi:GPH family glycoside/pentoside/hexuronide:cation symporter
MVGWILALYGYQANVEQTEVTQTGIRMMLSIFPGIGALIAAGFMFFYPLKESVLQTIGAELALFRSQSGRTQ